MEQTSEEAQRPPPSVPHVIVTTAGVDPAVRTRSPAGPRGRDVTTPAAAQRPAGPRTPPGAMATWRGEPQTVSVRLQCRRASRGQERPEPATSARLEEPGPGPRDPGRGAARAGRARGARVRSGGPRAGITRRRRGALAERRFGRPADRPEKAIPLQYRRDNTVRNTLRLLHASPDLRLHIRAALRQQSLPQAMLIVEVADAPIQGALAARDGAVEGGRKRGDKR